MTDDAPLKDHPLDTIDETETRQSCFERDLKSILNTEIKPPRANKTKFKRMPPEKYMALKTWMHDGICSTRIVDGEDRYQYAPGWDDAKVAEKFEVTLKTVINVRTKWFGGKHYFVRRPKPKPEPKPQELPNGEPVLTPTPEVSSEAILALQARMFNLEQRVSKIVESLQGLQMQSTNIIDRLNVGHKRWERHETDIRKLFSTLTDMTTMVNAIGAEWFGGKWEELKKGALPAQE